MTNSTSRILNKTNRFVQNAKKSQEGENDLDEKFRTIYLLRDIWNMRGLTDEFVMIPGKNWPNYPDVLIKAHDPMIAIDLHGDGPHHWDSARDQTRRYEYSLTKTIYIEIYELLTDGYSKEGIKEVLERVFDHFGIESQ